VRESIHSQILRPPNIIKASTLGQSGIWCPATSTSGCITKRSNCAKLISPKTMLATLNPSICEFMFRPFRWFENMLSTDREFGTKMIVVTVPRYDAKFKPARNCQTEKAAHKGRRFLV